jgi:hypothetical protein
VPAVDLVVGDNVLVFKSRELWGGQSYFDYRLSQPTYTPPETPASPASSVTTIATASTPSGLLQLRYSNNGGHTYSDWRLLDIGSTGSFIKELVCRRLGLARHRVWEVRDTSDAPADVLSVMLDA